MEVQTIVNGKISLVIVPQNEMEKKLLEQLTNQDNEVIHTKEGFQILGKSVSEALVIRSTSAAKEDSNSSDEEV